MLMAAAVLPSVFSKDLFSDPGYHANVEMFLRGIDSNGVVLVDGDQRIYRRLCDAVESLANTVKGKTSHALFEELLKKQRQKVIRFVKTARSFNTAQADDDVAVDIARVCEADALIGRWRRRRLFHFLSTLKVRLKLSGVGVASRFLRWIKWATASSIEWSGMSQDSRGGFAFMISKLAMVRGWVGFAEVCGEYFVFGWMPHTFPWRSCRPSCSRLSTSRKAGNLSHRSHIIG
jgi:hypothetical protein